MTPEQLPLDEFFRLYEPDREAIADCGLLRYGWVDVRSEGEFARASLPGFVNIPILTDSERQEVGIAYKRQGPEHAVRLGHELVDPHRPERARAWKKVLEQGSEREGVMICWRGGMRSAIAAEWVRDAGARARTVEGGIKAIRAELLRSFESGALPELLILAGLTGSGKTELLRKASRSTIDFAKVDLATIDLEGLANHRGSSFGRKLASPQPAQARFENELALELRRARRLAGGGRARVLLEDESSMIGNCFLPRELQRAMSTAPCVWVESPLEERAARIFAEYVLEPLGQGFAPEAVHEGMAGSLERIRRRLGGLETTKIRALLQDAFSRDTRGERPQADHHLEWIGKLLALYYDPMYRYGFEQCEKAGREILFRGTAEECLQWLRSN